MAQQTPRRLPLSGRPSNGNSTPSAFVGKADSHSHSHSLSLSPSPTNSVVLARDASLSALTGLGPHSPGNSTMDSQQDLELGDTVEVPGGMTGTVKFIGSVHGKKGVFAGVELSREYAARGKNDGDVDGTRYFTTSVPGSGIFLPAHRAARATSPTTSSNSFPPTPTTPGPGHYNFDKRSATPSNQDPSHSFHLPTEQIHRSWLAAQLQPIGRPWGSRSKPSDEAAEIEAITTATRISSAQTPSMQPLNATTTPSFSRSVNSARPSPSMSPVPRSSLGNKSPARPGSRSQSRNAAYDVDSTPIASRRTNGVRAQTALSNGSRPSSKDSASAEEALRLRRDLEERDRQLKDQASSLAEMESSLAELQTMFNNSAMSKPAAEPPAMKDEEPVSSDVTLLRSMLREKQERISSLTAEFDNHRADFRNTIDTLEMASTETERVYEKRVEELLQELEQVNGREDVESVARQLKQLEELVAELEEGLEDARRGEAEARGEVEFLRGEVERGRSELRREREKAAKALKGSKSSIDFTPPASNSREIEQRDDEIRGLKAIIHSLSSGPDMGSPVVSNRNSVNNTTKANGAQSADELARMRDTLNVLSREKSELQGLIEHKSFREEELERELNALRSKNSSNSPNLHSSSNAHEHTHSIANSTTSASTAFLRPSTASSTSGPSADFTNFPAPPPLSVPGLKAKHQRPTTASSAGGALHSDGALTFHDASESRNAEAGVVAAKPATNGPSAALSSDGPAPGRASEIVDMSKWCALCERDGHESVDCPFEDDF